MSTIQDNQAPWTSLARQQLDSKYEKCRNITEEIYKRINITFQIKKLESGEQSDITDNSDQIDSNELSNETDLFACDKSDISSSTEAEKTHITPCAPPYININNNNEERNKQQIYKRPRKRFRKRVKKRPPNRKRSDSEGSSDEAPLSRSALILSPDLKPKSPIEKKPSKKPPPTNNLTLRQLLKPDIKVPTVLIEKIQTIDKEADKITETTDKTKSSTDNKKVDETVNLEINRDVLSTVVLTPINKKNMTAIDSKEEKNAEVSGKDECLSVVGTDNNISKDVKITDWKSCNMCSLSFRGERGLRRHMSMSHILYPEGNK